MDYTLVNNLFETYKERALFGRYIRLDDLTPLIAKLPSGYKIESLGSSVLGRPIQSITIGSGDLKILMWSQMHGNESTTTKAVFDLLNSFKDDRLVHILKACTIVIIPMLNPDGCEAYTRLNANQVDLNRDAQELSQPESKVLRDCYDAFKPDFCFNLHGQRTLFCAGQTNNVATLSFLSPSADKQRGLTVARKQAMEVINAINHSLQRDLPDQIGRYDDGFNINCVGDTFHFLETPTVLFEAGHYKDDYDREAVRCFVYKALIAGLDVIVNTEITGDNYVNYFDIPENGKLFYDIIIRKALFEDQILDIGINYEEVLVGKQLKFRPKVITIADLSSFYGHKELIANNSKVFTTNKQVVSVGYENDFVIIDNVKLSLNV
ncbi:M14 family zinc carboxypeptidase [Psychroserpens sp. NJDZ02]|uniref:M14 family zinc carboxypeptidase n=1 Tax=Psychroserpens sp. NJDZ02 TaxID=2570561 RepID=UPI0010A917FF|nr:M14 family zinc carboxypeptidase [Psychroserpens sp. NJDZ02]QCE42819.1 peptidase M14 [Psychroserpens sp. NJDZ02]